MTDTPLVSIPVFTYNGAAFLEAQLDSLYAQTYPNIEVIVCDDGSIDGTAEILERYKHKHGLYYELNAKNLGLNQNVAKAFSLCKGEFIAPCDQDDIWFPEKIETLLHAIEDNQLVYSKNVRIDIHDKPVDIGYQKTDNLTRGQNPLAFLFGNCTPGHTMLFRSNLLQAVLPMPANVLLFDKWIMYVASLEGTVDYVDMPLVHYRQHENQTTYTKKEKSFLPLKRFLKKDAQKLQYYEKQRQHLELMHAKLPEKHEHKELLGSILNAFSELGHCYKSTRLKNILLEHRHKLFAMESESKHQKIAERMSRGIWYYRVRLYL